jgi:hypothetical protein
MASLTAACTSEDRIINNVISVYVSDINGSVSGVFARYVQFIGTPTIAVLCGKCIGRLCGTQITDKPDTL